MERIRVPTFLIQGTADTLFTLDEAITQLRDPARQRRAREDDVVLRRPRRVPDRRRRGRAHRARRGRVDEAPPRGRQERRHRPARSSGSPTTPSGAPRADYPLPAGTPIVARGLRDAGRHPRRRGVRHADLRRPGRQRRLRHRAAARRRRPGGGRAVAVADLLGHRPATHVFAQIVDETRGVVVGNQVTPIPVTLDGALAHRDALAGGDRGQPVAELPARAAGDGRQPGLRPGARRGSVQIAKARLEIPTVGAASGGGGGVLPGSRRCTSRRRS